jgi:hypothetical protein
VIYKANGGTGDDKTDNVAYGQTYTIGSNPFISPAGSIFAGWNTLADGNGTEYNPDEQIIITTNIELFAVWKKVSRPTKPVIIEEPEPPISPFIDSHVAYIIGYPEGDVRPENDITRAEVATVFFRLLSDQVRETNWTKENIFRDVKKSNWYNNAVSVMSNMGIVNGYPTGTFKPNSSITRAELAVIAVRFARIMGMDGNNEVNFSDISSHWAQNDIRFAASIGWVTGYPNGTYRPNLPITRAEFMTLVNRMLKRIPLSPDDLLANRMSVWKDNTYTDAWFYLAVQEATNSHVPESREEIVAKLKFPFERWIDMTENPSWAELEKEWSEN